MVRLFVKRNRINFVNPEKNIIGIFINLFLFFSIVNCNFEEQCKSHTPNDNYDVCYLLIQNYNNAEGERRLNIRTDIILTTCLMTYHDIRKCKKESTRWPLPD